MNEYIIRNPKVNWQTVYRGSRLNGGLLLWKANDRYRLWSLNTSAMIIWMSLKSGQCQWDFSGEKSVPPQVLSNFIEKLKVARLVLNKASGDPDRSDSVSSISYGKIKSPAIKEITPQNNYPTANWHRDVMSYLSKNICNGQLHFPLKVNFDITTNCNLRCKSCYLFAEYVGARELSFDQVARIVDKIAEANVPTINLFGGEPFMRKDIFKIVDYIRSKNITVVINTNATLLNNAKIERLKGAILHVSLDGATSKTHNLLRGEKKTFHKVLKNIIRLVRAGIDVQVNMTINHFNFPEVLSAYFIVRRIGVNNFTLSPTILTGRAKGQYHNNLGFFQKRLLKFYKLFFKIVCFAIPRRKTNVHFISCDAFAYAHVDASANVHFCTKMPRSKPVGSLLEHDLLKLWNSKELRDLHDENVQLDLPCIKCLFKRQCLYRYCRAENYAREGKLLITRRWCIVAPLSQVISFLLRIK